MKKLLCFFFALFITVLSFNVKADDSVTTNELIVTDTLAISTEGFLRNGSGKFYYIDGVNYFAYQK